MCIAQYFSWYELVTPSQNLFTPFHCRLLTIHETHHELINTQLLAYSTDTRECRLLFMLFFSLDYGNVVCDSFRNCGKGTPWRYYSMLKGEQRENEIFTDCECTQTITMDDVRHSYKIYISGPSKVLLQYKSNNNSPSLSSLPRNPGESQEKVVGYTKNKRVRRNLQQRNDANILRYGASLLYSYSKRICRVVIIRLMAHRPSHIVSV